MWPSTFNNPITYETKAEGGDVQANLSFAMEHGHRKNKGSQRQISED